MQRTDLAKEKTGIFTGAYAVNPVNGEKIPVWVADYVLISYGTGAIMAVPAHDTRDFEFATKFKLPIVQVVSRDGSKYAMKEAETGDGTAVNSGEFDGMKTAEFKKAVTERLEKEGKGKKALTMAVYLCEIPVTISRKAFDESPDEIAGRADGPAGASCLHCGGRAAVCCRLSGTDRAGSIHGR